jgi:DMSO/TMAO reductase YedYZ molybdopterin-dependent catalytic subunit
MADSRSRQRQRSGRAGFIAGIAGGVVVAVMLVAGIFTGGMPVVALALWERALRVLPFQVFGFLIVRLKFLAKPLAFWGMLATLVIGLGVLGLVLARWRWLRGRPGATALAAFLLSFVPLAALTVGPAAGFLQARLEAEGTIPAVSALTARILLAVGAYAAAFTAIFLALTRLVRPGSAAAAPPDGNGMTRREVLHRSVVLLAGAVAGTMLARAVTTAGRQAVALAQSVFQKIKGLPPEVTPTKDFYIVSKNPFGFDPVLDAAKWSLDIGGLVTRPQRLTFDEIKALPAVERYHTLECISNEIGGDLISNAKWKGVRLRDLLARAGGPAGKTTKVAFRCADGYTESIPLDDALNPDTLVVYEMNTEPLTPKHGFPVRLLVPGYFGMKNPKWITRIEPVDYNFQGYWERSGWTDDAVVQTMSKFTTPNPRMSVRLGEEVGVGGVAYAGKRGIRAVQFSTDEGKTWLPAEIKTALGEYTWVLWGVLWKPQTAGEVTLAVRAQDGGGRWQTANETATLPSGATGYHRIRLRVGR